MLPGDAIALSWLFHSRGVKINSGLARRAKKLVSIRVHLSRRSRRLVSL